MWDLSFIQLDTFECKENPHLTQVVEIERGYSFQIVRPIRAPEIVYSVFFERKLFFNLYLKKAGNGVNW